MGRRGGHLRPHRPGADRPRCERRAKAAHLRQADRGASGRRCTGSTGTGGCEVSDRTALGDRMKAHEAVYKMTLPPRSYSMIRVDIRAAHTLLRGAAKPFDYDFMTAMDITAVALCEQVQNAVLGYVQSDEISVLAANFTGPDTQPWFGGNIQKQVSIS